MKGKNKAGGREKEEKEWMWDRKNPLGKKWDENEREKDEKRACDAFLSFMSRLFGLSLLLCLCLCLSENSWWELCLESFLWREGEGVVNFSHCLFDEKVNWKILWPERRKKADWQTLIPLSFSPFLTCLFLSFLVPDREIRWRKVTANRTKDDDDEGRMECVPDRSSFVRQRDSHEVSVFEHTQQTLLTHLRPSPSLFFPPSVLSVCFGL